jgi:hypothetical protein
MLWYFRKDAQRHIIYVFIKEKQKIVQNTYNNTHDDYPKAKSIFLKRNWCLMLSHIKPYQSLHTPLHSFSSWTADFPSFYASTSQLSILLKIASTYAASIKLFNMQLVTKGSPITKQLKKQSATPMPLNLLCNQSITGPLITRSAAPRFCLLVHGGEVLGPQRPCSTHRGEAYLRAR